MDLIPQVAHAAPRVVHHIANCKPLIKQGFTWASIYWPIISHSVAAAIGGGLAWYFSGRTPAPIVAPIPTPSSDPKGTKGTEVPDVPVV